MMTTPFTLAQLHHVQLAIPPGGEEQCRAFWGGVLGMDEVEKPPVLAARGGCWFRGGGVEVHLGVEGADLVEQDAETPASIATQEGLAQILHDLPNEADVTAEVPRLLAAASPEAALADLREIPAKWCSLLAPPRLFAASLSNIETYRAAHAVDKPLCDLLPQPGSSTLLLTG